MFKKITISLLTTTLLILPSFAATGEAANQYITMDTGMLKNNRVLIPLRAVSENLGAEVNWNKELKNINITKDETTILLTINSKKILVNHEEVYLDVPAELNDNTTYVPARFISQTLGADVQWNQQTSQAIITLDGKQLQVTMAKPKVQVPNTKRITAKQQQIFVDKLNEATNLSSIKQIRTYFSAYFTDRFINQIIRDKGLEYDFKFKIISQSSLTYPDSNTARLSQYSGSSSIYGNKETLHRSATLIYTNKGWKVDHVEFSLIEEILNP